MKRMFAFVFLALLSALTRAETVALDFSSGAYDLSNYHYSEDGFTVFADHGFNSIHFGTLAWYEGGSQITISAGGSPFDLNSLTIVDTAYAGLVFESSNGGRRSVGSIKGPLAFSGGDWQSITYLKIHNIVNFSILNELDDMVLTKVSAVPEPAPALMTFAGGMLLCLIRSTPRKKRPNA